MMKRHIPEMSIRGILPSLPFGSVEVNGSRLLREMKETRTGALGWVAGEHGARIHFLMLQWPQFDSPMPKVMHTLQLPARISTPHSPRSLLHPPARNHPHCVSKRGFPPTCSYPQLSIRGFQLNGLRRTSPAPPPPPPSSSSPPHVFTPPWNYFYLAYFLPSLFQFVHYLYVVFLTSCTSKCSSSLILLFVPPQCSRFSLF